MKIFFIILFLFLNCHHARVNFNPADTPVVGTPQIIEDKVWWWTLKHTPKFWEGSPRIKLVDIKAMCPNGPQEVDMFLNWKQAIYSQLSFGVYIPYTIKVTCN
jgi:hypothetical protein